VCARDITAIWLTGSVRKRWDSPLDYVPELSDVDVHVRFARPEHWTDALDVEAGLVLHAAIEQRYADAVLDPLHTPRVQLVPVHQVEALPNYFGPPAGTAESLFGGAPPVAAAVDPHAASRVDAETLVAMADAEMLAVEPFRFAELPGWHLFGAIRNLNWRVSPAGARALSALGTAYETAWALNRTEALQHLRDAGEHELARSYAGYYEHAWAFFLSRWRDPAAGRETLAHGIRTIQAGAALGARVGG
jgi:hypothetical protein